MELHVVVLKRGVSEAWCKSAVLNVAVLNVVVRSVVLKNSLEALFSSVVLKRDAGTRH